MDGRLKGELNSVTDFALELEERETIRETINK